MTGKEDQGLGKASLATTVDIMKYATFYVC